MKNLPPTLPWGTRATLARTRLRLHRVPLAAILVGGVLWSTSSRADQLAGLTEHAPIQSFAKPTLRAGWVLPKELAIDGLLPLGPIGRIGLHTGHGRIAILKELEQSSRYSTYLSFAMGLPQQKFGRFQPSITASLAKQLDQNTANNIKLRSAAGSIVASWNERWWNINVGLLVWNFHFDSDPSEKRFSPKPIGSIQFVSPGLDKHTWFLLELDWVPTLVFPEEESRLDWRLNWGLTYSAFTRLVPHVLVSHRRALQNTTVSLGIKVTP